MFRRGISRLPTQPDPDEDAPPDEKGEERPHFVLEVQSSVIGQATATPS